MTIAHDEAVIDAAAVDAIFAEARTANTFTGEVTEEQARAIYELTKFGPTAFNSQPLRVTYVRSDEARATLVGRPFRRKPGQDGIGSARRRAQL